MARGAFHDVSVGGVEAESGGGQPVGHQVDPQQLDGYEGLGHAQCCREEDAVWGVAMGEEREREREGETYVRTCTMHTVLTIRMSGHRDFV